MDVKELQERALAAQEARKAQDKKYATYAIAKKLEELEELQTALDAARVDFSTLKTEIAGFYRWANIEMPTDANGITNEQLAEKLPEVMKQFPNGAKGEAVAAAIGLPGVDSQAIANFYKADANTVLVKRGKRLDVPMHFLYHLAKNPAEITAAKAAEKTAREAGKAKRAKVKTAGEAALAAA